MPRHHPNGVIEGPLMLGGVPYRRTQFMARRSTSFRDWLWFGLILVGLVLSTLLIVCLALLFVWVALSLIGEILRQVRDLWTR